MKTKVARGQLIFLPKTGSLRSKVLLVSESGSPRIAREREPITGVWGQSPQQGPGAEPLVRRSGGRSPLKLKAFEHMGVKRRRKNCQLFVCNSKAEQGTDILVKFVRFVGCSVLLTYIRVVFKVITTRAAWVVLFSAVTVCLFVRMFFVYLSIYLKNCKQFI